MMGDNIQAQADSSSDAGQTSSVGVEWSASEFIDHQKTAGWYALLLLAGALVAAIIFVLTRDYFAPVIIMMIALVFGISAAKKPRTLTYGLDVKGITVGPKNYAYESFKAFTVIQEGAIESIVLLPAKRWMPPMNLYFSPEDAERITDCLGSFLPYVEKSTGLVDSFLHRIRF